MIVYLIGSLRNPRIPEIANDLRAAGYDVFEDWFSGGKEADDEWQRHEKVRGRSFIEALNGYHAQHVFKGDFFHLNRCHLAVMALPVGRSAFIELGYVIGSGKPGFVFTDGNELPRYEVMAAFSISVTETFPDLLQAIEAVLPKRKHRRPPALPIIHPMDAMWLAGLLEGEGSFGMSTSKHGWHRPRIALQMTDHDTVNKAAKLLGYVKANGPYHSPSSGNRKPVWAINATGAKGAEWMRILYPYLGRRRQAKVKEVLSQYEEWKRTAWKSRMDPENADRLNGPGLRTTDHAPWYS
jgi:hypothetical protein